VPLSPLLYREVKRRLEAAGFTQVGQKGSHVKFIRQSGEATRTAIVPRHREVAVGTPRSVMRQAGLDPDEFERL
jgi:predicted RNA binding protein YcfA (HicA-like mRNA interferase family)